MELPKRMRFDAKVASSEANDLFNHCITDLLKGSLAQRSAALDLITTEVDEYEDADFEHLILIANGETEENDLMRKTIAKTMLPKLNSTVECAFQSPLKDLHSEEKLSDSDADRSHNTPPDNFWVNNDPLADHDYEGVYSDNYSDESTLLATELIQYELDADEHSVKLFFRELFPNGLDKYRQSKDYHSFVYSERRRLGEERRHAKRLHQNLVKSRAED